MIFRQKEINGFFLSGVICSLLLLSCRQIDVFEKNSTIPKYKWDNKYEVSGSFDIADTINPYNIYVVLRHKDSYLYNNLWLNVGLQSPGDTMYYQKVNLVLAADDANGWEGTGMNDIWEVRKMITGQPRRFIKQGKYNFSIRQIMRDNPLMGIMNVGLRVTKEYQ
ncbi:MAG: gliding motility lipoprotein GldH [Ferruginibacter sp.]